MAQKSNFDMHEFNRLPRPDSSCLEAASYDDLKKVFPFLFKPNRVLALPPRGDAGIDPGQPLKDRRSRWLIKLNPLKELEHSLCLAVIARDGWFSLWAYRLVPSETGEHPGLFPMPLRFTENEAQPGQDARTALSNSESWNNLSNNFNLLHRSLPNSEIENRLPQNFNLLRFVQHCDEDGILMLRLITPSAEHAISLDFGSHSPKNSITYHYNIHFPTAFADESLCRQIGGWNGCETFFLRRDGTETDEHLYAGSARLGKKVSFPMKSKKFRFSAAVEREGSAVAAEAENTLWFRQEPEKPFDKLEHEASLQGYVRFLELIPSTICTTRSPLILAGCNYYLYILDCKGKYLQRVSMGGSVDALLYLGGHRNDWFDVAVLVRNQGLFCARLFYDQFQFENKEKEDRKHFIARIWKLINEKKGLELPLKWLRSPDMYDKLPVLTALVREPSEKIITLFKDEQDLFAKLDSNVTTYLAHILHMRIWNILDNPADVKSPGKHLQHCLQLFLLMAQGPFHARIAVRNMEGWLLTLKDRLSKYPEAVLVDELIRELPDAKRLTQKLASDIHKFHKNGDIKNINKSMGIFLGLENRLRFDRLFNKLVLLPDWGAGRVDSVAMMERSPTFRNPSFIQHNQESHTNANTASTLCNHIYSARGKEALASFSMQGDIPTPQMYKGGWHHSLRRKFEKTQAVRVLAPINETLLLVVSGWRVGTAQKGQTEISWTPDLPAAMWSAAIYSNDNNNIMRIAVAGEWYPNNSRELVYGFEINNQGKLQKINEIFHAPKDWGKPVRLTALAWDKQGGLWAVTGSGRLLHWPRAASASPGRPVEAKCLASTGSTQHTLAALEDSVVCGGQDGVLRAFDFQGRLIWANLLPGTIRAVTKLSESHGEQFSALAVITDEEHLLLYGRDGTQEGILHIPGHYLFSMFSSHLRNDGIQYHLIGTLWGEVRLVEEAPKEWSATDYLSSKKNVDEITKKISVEQPDLEILKRCTEEIGNDQSLCRDWCTGEAAVNEPLRAAWAARQLLARPHQKNYKTVLKMLQDSSSRFDYSVLKLRSHVFACLGEHLDEIPSTHHKLLLQLCTKVKDGALAALLLHAPKHAKHNSILLHDIISTAYSKVLEGRPFISGALLQYLLRCLPLQSHQFLDEYLFFALNRPESHDMIHPGFIEGMLMILFKQLGLSEDGFFVALSRMPSQYPQLAGALLRCPELRKRFCHWLALYGSVLFSPDELRFWTSFSPNLEKTTADVPPSLKKTAEYLEKEDKRFIKMEDVAMLNLYLTLFPTTHDSLEYVLLPEEGWNKIRETTRQLQIGIMRINRHVVPFSEMQQWLEQYREILKKFSPSVPLLNNLDESWRQSWLETLNRLYSQVITDKPPESSKFERAIEPVRRFCQAMKDIGFTRGRFYRIIQVPGCDGILKLTYAEGGVPSGNPLPITCPINGVLAKNFCQYGKTKKLGGEKLIFNVRRYKKNEQQDKGTVFWDGIIHKSDREPWLEIPVLSRQAQEERQPVAVFAFDVPPNENLQEAVEQVKSDGKILRYILDDVVQGLTLEAKEKEHEWHLVLADLDIHLSREADRHAIEKALLKAAAQISDAKDGVLVTQEGAANRLIIRAAIGKPGKYYRHSYFDLDDGFYPIVSCWKSGKPLFEPDWRKSSIRKHLLDKVKFQKISPEDPGGVENWLSKDIRSLAVMPILSGDKKVGVISLDSLEPYSFTLDRVRALERLLQRVRWFLHAAELIDRQRHWEYAFVHEMRSDLAPIKHKIHKVIKKPSSAVKNLTQAQRHCERLLNLTEDFMSLQRRSLDVEKNESFFSPVSLLKEFLNLYDESIKEARQNVVITPENLDMDIWQSSLLGNREVFARVLRNILDNALKYAGREVDISIKVEILTNNMWKITISNPGWMTPEENLLKFTAYEKPDNARRDGAHVGLAASWVWVNAYGGELILENKEEKGKQQVCAILCWPLAKKNVKEELS